MSLNNFEDFITAFEKARGTNFVAITLVHIAGSAPQEVGARCLVSDKGLLAGTVGGGKIEAAAIKFAQELLEKKETHSLLRKWNLQTDIGMSCGGEVSLFFEAFTQHKTWKIAVFGAGHVAQELIRCLMNLDCEVTVVDHRQEWLDKLPRHRRLQGIHSQTMEDVVDQLPDDTFVAIMTMGHKTDLPILARALRRNFPYVGNMGSEVKARALKQDLINLNVDKNSIAKMYCPIGENLGGNMPAEIAISITAQLLKVRGN